MMQTLNCPTPAPAAHASGWTTYLRVTLSAGVDPASLIASLNAIQREYPSASLLSQFDWTNYNSVRAWASTKHPQVVVDTYTTCLLAQENNRLAIKSFQHSLMNLCGRELISIQAMTFSLEGLNQSIKLANDLLALACALHDHLQERGEHHSPPADTIALAELASGAVLNRHSGQMSLDPQAEAVQLTSSIEGFDPGTLIPDDGRSPIDEIRALFSITT